MWDTDIATVLDLVRSGSTSDIYLYGHEAIDERYPKHTPDASFAHAHSQYPSLVIETSYPQRQKELTRLADEYISGSDGNIATILGLDTVMLRNRQRSRHRLIRRGSRSSSLSSNGQYMSLNRRSRRSKVIL